MSNGVYPAASIHSSEDLWAELPREDMGIQEYWDGRKFFIGCFWAFVGDIAIVVIGYMAWHFMKGLL